MLDDARTARLVEQLACLSGTSEQEAVRHAVEAELDRINATVSLSERLQRLRDACPLPPPTGLLANKAFFDEMSGEE